MSLVLVIVTDSDGFVSVPVTVNGSPAEVKVPEDVITRALSGAYDPGECIDEGEGYALMERVLDEHPSEGLFVEQVTISTPEGVKLRVFEAYWDLKDGLTKYYPVEQVLDEEDAR
jgi:hypothetical protein